MSENLGLPVTLAARAEAAVVLAALSFHEQTLEMPPSPCCL